MKIKLPDGTAEITNRAPFKSFVASIEPVIETPILFVSKTSCSLIKDSVEVDLDFDSQVDCLSVKTDKLIKEVTIDFGR